ncbi:MAG: 2-dehydropantoate 2-reductase, partial [Bacteroidales bacterium]|nr:2-dehydropantoate 2-reductase [Bacteroidales bacterium]
KYDFIFVSVPAGGITDVMNSLNEQEIQGTIILVCGIWYDHNELNKIMKGWKYILGYPVAGGNISDEVLNCCVFDHFMLEKEEKADIKNYKELIKLFYDCNVKLEIPYDMLEWIWIHMAINAGVITVAGKYGDINDTTASAEKLMNSLKELSEVVISIRETTKIIEARGVKLKHYKNELLPYKIPSKIAAVVMKKMFAKNLLTRKIMTLHSNINDLLYVCQNVNTCGKQYSVKAPVFYENCNITGLSKALSKRQNK